MTPTSYRSRVFAASIAAVMLSVGASLAGADRTDAFPASSVCVRDVGDLNGDGHHDFAVSRRSALHPRVFIVHGDGQPPAIEELQQGRRRAALVMRGREAAALLCSDLPQPPPASRSRTARAIGAATVTAVGPVDRPPSYSVVDLDPLMPGFAAGFSSAAAAINTHGDVVGRFSTATGDRAYLYRQGVVHDLGTLGGHQSAASGINDDGTVVGDSVTGEVGPGGFLNAAFRYDAGQMQNLGLSWGDARAINRDGRIVGQMRFAPDVDQLTAFSLDDEGGLQALGAVAPGRSSVALAINAAGRIVGESASRMPGVSNPAITHASTSPVVFENGTARELGFLGRACFQGIEGAERCADRGAATAVTDRGLIVGFSTIGSATHAFMSDGGALVDLGSLDGGSTFAYAANESGQVVGSAQAPGTGALRPFLYDAGAMYDLTTLVGAPTPLSSLGAYAINSFGVIALQHHVLTPNYASVAAGRPYRFQATLLNTLSFEYWSADLAAASCAAGDVRLQIRFDDAPAPVWVTVATVDDCQDRSWHPVTVPLTSEVNGSPRSVSVRLRAPGADGSGSVYLRRFRVR